MLFVLLGFVVVVVVHLFGLLVTNDSNIKHTLQAHCHKISPPTATLACEVDQMPQ